eukprot:COSAG02_NODE_633_length_19262_cov_32.473256_2_plen_93_part_00
MDEDRYQNAVFIINTAEQPVTVSLPAMNVSTHFDCTGPKNCPEICGRDMYTGKSVELKWNASAITTTIPVRTQSIGLSVACISIVTDCRSPA